MTHVENAARELAKWSEIDVHDPCDGVVFVVEHPTTAPVVMVRRADEAATTLAPFGATIPDIDAALDELDTVIALKAPTDSVLVTIRGAEWSVKALPLRGELQ